MGPIFKIYHIFMPDNLERPGLDEMPNRSIAVWQGMTA